MNNGAVMKNQTKNPKTLKRPFARAAARLPVPIAMYDAENLLDGISLPLVQLLAAREW